MLTWPRKDPNEILDYDVNWNETLEVGETITATAFTVVTGDVVKDTEKSLLLTAADGIATVWLSGGTAGTKCEILNRISTSVGRTYDQTTILRIRGK